EWVHVQLHQQKGMISLSPPTICNSAWKPMWNRGICWNVKGPPVIITLIQGAAWNSENKPR
ncbi:hypothetical protein P2N75_26210, partial [Escherichia coli]